MTRFVPWVLVALCFVLGVASRSISDTFVVFVPALQSAFEASRSAVTLIYSFALLVGGIAAPISGWIVDRFGLRMLTVIGMIGGGARHPVGLVRHRDLASLRRARHRHGLRRRLAVGRAAAPRCSAAGSRRIAWAWRWPSPGRRRASAPWCMLPLAQHLIVDRRLAACLQRVRDHQRGLHPAAAGAAVAAHHARRAGPGAGARRPTSPGRRSAKRCANGRSGR